MILCRSSSSGIVAASLLCNMVARYIIFVVVPSHLINIAFFYPIPSFVVSSFSCHSSMLVCVCTHLGLRVYIRMCV